MKKEYNALHQRHTEVGNTGRDQHPPPARTGRHGWRPLTLACLLGLAFPGPFKPESSGWLDSIFLRSVIICSEHSKSRRG